MHATLPDTPQSAANALIAATLAPMSLVDASWWLLAAGERINEIAKQTILRAIGELVPAATAITLEIDYTPDDEGQQVMSVDGVELHVAGTTFMFPVDGFVPQHHWNGLAAELGAEDALTGDGYGNWNDIVRPALASALSVELDTIDTLTRLADGLCALVRERTTFSLERWDSARVATAG